MEVQKVQEKRSEFLKIEKNHPNSEKFNKNTKKSQNKRTFIKQKISNIRNKTDKLTK